MNNFATLFLYFLFGSVVGVCGTFYYVTPKFDLLTKDALQHAKISFLRGCTQNNTLETCKNHPGYTDPEEIFDKVEIALNEEIDPPAMHKKNNMLLNLSGEEKKELQKVIQGRSDKSIQFNFI